MPNWAWGTVDATGTKEALLAFSKRFIMEDEPVTLEGVKFFYRTFLNLPREDVEQEITRLFDGCSPDDECTQTFNVDFAWSAASCLEKNPFHDPDGKCITLSEACVADQVDVEIHTKEPGMWFEETITCDRKGMMVSNCQDLRVARCRNCGETESFASNELLEDLVCTECGSADFELCEEAE